MKMWETSIIQVIFFTFYGTINQVFKPIEFKGTFDKIFDEKSTYTSLIFKCWKWVVD